MDTDGSREKRLADLEKICREDRERWKRIGEYILRGERRWAANDERWRANDERWRANDRKMEEMIRELKRLSERMDATWRLLHRHLEATDSE